MIEFKSWDYEIVRQYAEQTGQKTIDVLIRHNIKPEVEKPDLERENAALNATIDNIVSIIGKGDDIDLLAEIRSMKVMSDALKALACQ